MRSRKRWTSWRSWRWRTSWRYGRWYHFGGTGSDNLSGGAGLDTIDGGEGNEEIGGGDNIDYSSEAQSLDINLKNVGTDLAAYSTATIGGQKADYLKNIENIAGTTDDDYIGGDDDRNTLQGNYGNDII